MGEGDGPWLVETPANPAPPGAECFWLRASDGVRLRAASWSGGDRGTVVLLQGRTEFIEKYFETIGDLRARGFGVITFDWRGQGLSDRLLSNRLKGHAVDFLHYVRDLDAVLERAASHCPKPWVLLAHSMGSVPALDKLRADPTVVSRAVLCAAMTQIRVRHRRIVAFVAALAPKTAFVPAGDKFNPALEPFERSVVTHDRARFLRNRGVIEAQPDLGLGSPTFGWLNAAFAAMNRVTAPKFLAAISTPSLVLSAGGDRIIDSASHAPLARGLKEGTHVLIKGARHELMMERDDLRAEFWRAFDGFVAR